MCPARIYFNNGVFYTFTMFNIHNIIMSRYENVHLDVGARMLMHWCISLKRSDILFEGTISNLA